MGRLPTGRMGQALALALLALLLGAIWVAVAVPVLEWHADRADALERRSALARRMAALAAGLPALQQQAASASASAGAGPAAIAVLDGASDAVAAAALTQKLQEMAGQAGASLASTEALPAEQQGAYRRIAVRVAVSAPWPVLVRLLGAIEGATPQMLADELQIRGQRGFIRDGAAPLEASWVVMGFRSGTSGS